MNDRMKGLRFGIMNDSSIDPDEDFSYIDVKIRDFLGDFQKDFEGGVFRENLGAKYDEYGSFLLACKRLPQSRSAPKAPGRTIVPSTRGSSYEGTCNGLSNQMKVSSTSSFNNSKLGGSSIVGASTRETATKNHTKDHNVINKVGTMTTKKKNFHARDVTTEHKSKRPKSRKESSHNYSEELKREVGRPDHMVAPLIAKNGIKNNKTDMKKSSMKSLDSKSGMPSSEEPVETFNNWACCDICQKWRLLPNGINPKVLPKEWECCMQYWLPNAMTSCITSEAETTNFMNLHHHASLPEGNSNHEGSAPSTCSDTPRVNQMSREVVSRCDVDCSQVRQPNYISSEKQKLKFKLKGKKLQYCSDGVDIISGVGKGLELMSNELFHPDIPVENNIMTDLPTKVSPPHLANGISTANSVGKKMEQIGDEFLNNSMHELKGSFSSLNGTMEHLEFHARKKFKHVDVIDTLMSGKSVFPVKKRKAREWHDTQNNQETAMRSHHLGEKEAKLGEECIGSNVRKENRDNAPNIKKRNCVLGGKDTDLIKTSSAQTVPRSPSQVSHLISSVKANGLESATGETYYNLADLDRLTEEFEDKNVAQHGSSEHKKVNELDKLCPMRKCQPSSAALMAMKEARELKHAADRMKHVEQELERATIYFQAALKFLQAASLSEPSSVVNMKYEELNESLKIYIETAAFCEFCALEYDRSKEIAFSALAYKCAEVAYFKVAFLKSHFASKDHQELQETIHAFWPGDSPSSSTSDLVNLNYPGALEKITCAKVVSSLQNSDSHAIASRHSLHRWLDYAQVSVSALEASRKSQNALAVASASLGESGYDSIASLKETLNFGFHNVEELLRRIRASMEFFYH
ncbi:hypothetical protein KSP40_PGU014075 [Platanthera guangdongensis]|uniref:CW-type domain-containing protein n=1 Tax=Platanthera guangdongensis TaxID=2320717 RepID=A0ABR2MXE8_9ASPA